jgi:hypothetical protein
MSDFISFFSNIFGIDSWPARWSCGIWTSFHGWLYILSSLAIAISYFIIPFYLCRLIRERTDLPFPKLFFGFISFIFFCGATHFMDAIAFWFPVYRFSAILLFLTAIISLVAVLNLRKIIPAILSFRSINELEKDVTNSSIALDKSKDHVTKLHNDIDTYVYAASHDLKSPINNMEGLLDILKEDIANQQIPSAVIIDKLQNSIHRVQNTISRLTDVIKLEKNPYDDIEVLTWNKVLEEIITENEEVIRISGASITTQFNVSEIEYSHGGLKSILYNLVVNSIKYADPSRSPEIEIVTSLENDRIKLEVIDNGLGIDLERHRDRLFGLFKRLHSHVEGSGIGLYSVKQLVERKGGEINVDSVLGKGSTFYIYFS